MTKPLQLIDAGPFRQSEPEWWTAMRWHLLAEGDSWFSLGALNLSSANLLQSMAFSEFAGAVHCSYPGDTLRRMVDQRRDRNFQQLLRGNVSRRWDAILLSAGGNDLIDAVQSAPTSPADKRLLRPQADWGSEAEGAARYFSAAGWQTFSDYFRANLDLMIGLRDSKTGIDGNAGRPLCLHTYAYPTPRPSGPGLGRPSWLLPAMQRYAIPKNDWMALATLLVDRLAELMLDCAAQSARFPAVHVFDSRALPTLVPAVLDSTGPSGDWLNEIHLTRGGCDKVAAPWCAQIEALMLANP